MYDIYYAHHRWKYNTKVEDYEYELIKRYFPKARIFDPSVDLNTHGLTEPEIMDLCLKTVRNTDILVFSSMDGVIGTGVYHEVEEAQNTGKLVLYIFHNKLNTNFEITRWYMLPGDNDRLYATVNIKED